MQDLAASRQRSSGLQPTQGNQPVGTHQAPLRRPDGQEGSAWGRLSTPGMAALLQLAHQRYDFVL